METRLDTSSMVIAEIVWTLESRYGLSKKEIHTMRETRHSIFAPWRLCVSSRRAPYVPGPFAPQTAQKPPMIVVDTLLITE